MRLNNLWPATHMTRRIAGFQPSRPQLAGAVLLLVVGIWGASFVVVQAAVAAYPVVGFLFLRFLLGGAVLMAAAHLRRSSRPQWRTVPRGSLLGVGTALTVGYLTQTMGLALGAPAGVAATLTSLVVVLVPAWDWLVTGNAPERRVVITSLLAVSGTVLICHTAAPSFRPGELSQLLGVGLELISAAAFALQVVLVARLGKSLSATALGGAQLLLVAVMLLPALPLAGGLPIPSGSVMAAIVFSALGASAFGFAVQAAAQRHLSTETAAVVMATEPGFALLTAAAVGAESLGLMALLGLALLMAAVAAQGEGFSGRLRQWAGEFGAHLRYRLRQA